ncbi:MAG TPA: GNAT family N-acetyltransferase [Solirubrobacterales bacterium]
MDLVEQRLWRDIWGSTDPAIAAARGVEARSFGPIQVTAIRDLPDSRWLNLVLGAATPDAVGDGHLEAAIAWADSLGVSYYVPVTPAVAGAAAAEEWLRANGFEHGYGWMKFKRPGGTVLENADLPRGVEIRELARGEGADFGAIVASGFGLPDWAAALFDRLPGHQDWRCYLAEVDGEPGGCAALLIDGEMAEFGIAATLEHARGRGCQSALLRRRIEDAEGAGCRTLFVETGERTEDRPSASYRNILRAGFEETYVRPNWQRPD